MRRTQIYLTDEQRRRLASRAKGSGRSEAAVVREVLDEALGIAGSADVAAEIIRSTSGALPDAPDWPAWLKRVRGRTMSERLEDLGL